MTVRGAAAAALALGLLAAVPVLTGRSAVLNWLFLVLLHAGIAQSWNLLAGFGGQVNLGHAAFFGLGAVVARILWLDGAAVPWALFAGVAAAGAAGLLIGAPSLRLRGAYFAIGTLALAEILRITFANAMPEVSALSAAQLGDYALAPRYYLALLLAAGTTTVAWGFSASRFGLGLAAIREDEDVAAAIGIPTFRQKLLALLASTVFAGLAGGVFAYYHLSFYPSFAFSPIWTFDALIITFLGGVGTVWGPVVGAAFFILVREALALRLAELHLLIFGVLFVLVVVAFPGGLMQAGAALGRRLGAPARPAQRPQQG
ncbi:MAG: branched-chain amino acid ABC transporter permease [Armatimonadota bacterium]|nr:branched-chain amino acid ABC transporter permease [Armatimonadota bacterium]MDR7452994.1 branched-chain amino acid ABC transporter permease [Armatimonadota bacterium]MDR7457551.1 branched-chain amino acid ABC transporter permease [Armatimonadota bacterium]MDR7496329.1 branched-chain amino acid ABC transporter permease [Armatimonadota bacterium]